MIREELLKAFVGQRVMEHLLEDFVSQRANVDTNFGSFDNLTWSTDGRGQNLRFVSVVRVDLDYVTDQVHAGPANIVDPPDKRADDISTRFCCQQSLRGAEAKSDIDANPLFGESGSCLYALLDERYFDNDILVNFRELQTFRYHLPGRMRNDFRTNVAIEQMADFAHAFLDRNALLGNQAWIRGDAINDAPGAGVFQLV